MTHEEMVREFMMKHNQRMAKAPMDGVSSEVKILRLRLMMEELGELASAIHENNVIEIADGLADLDYVVTGTALAFGIPHEMIFREVHRSNMTKPALDKNAKGGKVAKEGYERPNIESLLKL